MEEPDLASAGACSSDEVHAAVSNVTRIPIELPSVKAIVISMEHEDSAFIEKSVSYLGTLEGARKSEMKVLTNSRLPTRFLFTVAELPKVSLDDLKHIDGMTSFLRSVSIDLDQRTLKFDVWKKKGKTSRKRDRSVSPVAVTDADIDGINLSSLHEEDKRVAVRIINAMKSMPEVLCQFQVLSRMAPPSSYIMQMKIRDTLDYKRVSKFHYAFRAFIENISFNFPEKSMDIKIKRLN